MKIPKKNTCHFNCIIIFLTHIILTSISFSETSNLNHSKSKKNNKITKNASEVFKTSVEQILSKDYSNAKINLTTLLNKGINSASIHYNLGLIYYNQQKIGKARLHLSRSKWLSPSNKKTNSLLNKILKENNLPINKTKWWIKPSNILSNFMWSKIFLVSLLGLFILVLIKVFLINNNSKKNIPSKKYLYIKLLNLILIFVSTLSILFIVLQFNENRHKAIIINTNAPLNISPTSNSDILATLKSGQLVETAESFKSYIKIKTNTNLKGWINNNNVEKIIE